MQKLVFKNGNNVTVDLTNHVNYGITSWQGFSADEINIQSQQVPFQDGAVFLDALLQERDLNVTLAIQDNNDLAKRYRLRRELIALMNPKLGEGILIYTNDFTSKQIHVIPHLPVFDNHNSNDAGTPKASLTWTACNPYWEDMEDKDVTFQIGQQPIIKNEGDIPCQLEMDWYTNYVKNGRVTNVTQNQKIKYNGDLNDSLKIVTAIGKKSVTTEKMGFDVSNIGNIIQSICYSAELGLFVAVGYSGKILTSPDGITWTSRTSGVSVYLTGVTYSAELGLFVAVGESGTILYSVFSLAENKIQNISADSDIGMNLGIGNNQFRINKDDGNMVVRIKYRQKYLGV